MNYRSTRGILYPERHVGFVLDGPGWPAFCAPPLPASKDTFSLAHTIENTDADESKALVAKAEQMREREMSGKFKSADYWAGTEVIDTFLLCAKENPEAITTLAKMLGYGLTQLQTLTETGESEIAAAELLILLAESVQGLQHLAVKSPDLFRKTAKQLPSIPLLASYYKEQQLENTRLLKDLEVGAEHWWKQQRKPRAGSKTGRAKEIALQLIDYLQNYRLVCRKIASFNAERPKWTENLSELPPLSKESWRQWFDLAWEVVLETTHGKPADVDAYREIARRTRRKNEYGNVTDAAKTEIREALKDSFRELTTGSSARAARRRH